MDILCRTIFHGEGRCLFSYDQKGLSLNFGFNGSESISAQGRVGFYSFELIAGEPVFL